MSIPETFEKIRSGVVHFIFENNGTRMGSGSGFVFGGHILTNHHVYRDTLRFQTRVRYYNEATNLYRDRLFEVGGLRLQSGSDENSYDFAILDAPDIPLSELHNFELGEWKNVRTGSKILLLGFPFEIDRLTIHRGIVSAQFASGVATIFQLDASVNPSNSGGPLVEQDSGRLIGIVTRRHTGFTGQFDQLVENIEASVQMLEKPRMKMIIGGLDPVNATIFSLKQLHGIALELRRSANVGIGYAFALDGVAQDLGF